MMTNRPSAQHFSRLIMLYLMTAVFCSITHATPSETPCLQETEFEKWTLSCIKQHSSRIPDVSSCLVEKLLPTMKAEVVPTSGYIIFDSPRPVCVGKTTFIPNQSPLLIVYNNKGQLISLLNFKGDIHAGNVTLNDDVCFAADKSIISQLSDQLKFIPSGTSLRSVNTACTSDGRLLPRKIQLLQPATICGFSASVGQTFEATNEWFAFTASVDGTIGTRNAQIPVKKGAKYQQNYETGALCDWIAQSR